MSQNNIYVRFKTLLGSSNANVSKLNANYDKLSSKAKSATGNQSKLYNQTKKTNDAFSKLTKDGNRASQSIGQLSNKFLSLTNVLKGIGAYKLGDAMFKSIQSTIDMAETINLFNVAMGEYAESTDRAISSISKLTGLDHTNLQDRVGTYNLLARSMGLTAENSAKLSENTARLALDLSSLSNVSINQVAHDLRSGLVGQSETMYKYGVDVTEASLKVEALNQGITKSVRKMSQGEKMALRYAVTMRQTALSHGDFANTIDNPANQLKILSDRMVTLGRAVGTLFIPMLSAVLPYLNAIVTALTNIILAVGVLIGYKPTDVVKNVSNGFSGISDDADGASDSIDKTGKAIKKLKGLMSFDEINILGSNDSGKKKKDEGSGSPFDLDLPEYDSMLNKVKQKSDELVQFIQPKLELLLKLVLAIGVGFLAWKISNLILDVLTNPLMGKGLLTTISAIGTKLSNITGLGLAGLIAIIILRVIDLTANSELFRKGLKAIWDMGKSIFKAFGEGFKSIMTWLGELGKKAWDVLPPSLQNTIINVFTTISKVAKALDLDVADLLITFAGFALLGTPFGIPLLAFEALTIAIRAIGYGASDAFDKISFLGTGISDVTISKLEPFREKMNELNDTLLSISWSGMIMDDETISNIKSKLSEVVKMIVDELDVDKNESLAKLAPLRKALGEEAYNDLVLANEKYYTTMKKKVTDDEAEIIKIIGDAQKNGGKLTQEHYDAINKIREGMNDTAIKHISETEIEYNAIMNTLKDNSTRISLEQATSIIANAKKTREDTIKNAELQYSSIELEAKRMVEVGAISDEQYKAIMESAKLTKDDTIKRAEEQYSGIYDATYAGLGKLARYMNTETDTMKTKWQIWTQKLDEDLGIAIESMRKGVKTWAGKMQGHIDDMKEDIGKGWESFWKGTANFFIGIMNNIGEGFTNGINNIKEKINDMVDDYNSAVGKVPILGGKLQVSRISMSSYSPIPRLARGGSLSAGQYFEAGEFGKAELIGNYNGQTTVMPLENSGFVDAMERAVARGISSVDIGNDRSPIIVNIGARTFVDEVRNGVDRRSMIDGKTIINI